MQTVLETEGHLNDAKRAGLSEQERMTIVECLAKDPQAGETYRGQAEPEKYGLQEKVKENEEDIG